MSTTRRLFLASTISGLAGGRLFGQEGTSPSTNFLPTLQKPSEASFRPDTLFLTWQRDPTTTMTIQWVGPLNESSDSNIYFSTAASVLLPTWCVQKTSSKPYPKTELHLFRAELTGLTPDTEYAFHIGKQSGTYYFRTMPAKATDTITFVSGGDCGTNEHAIANNIQAAKQDPMFCVIGGDLGYDNGKSADTSLAFLRNYSQHMVGAGGRMIPMLACLGNHEVDGSYNQPREKAPFFFALFDGIFSSNSYASLEFGDYLNLLLLDTGHISTIEGPQTSWLEENLKARVDHPHVIAVNHVPAYPSFRSMQDMNGKAGTGSANRQHWVPLFEKYRVPVVLEHHDHTFKRTRPLLNGMAHNDGVLYLGDGSWGRLRAPQKPDKMSIFASTSEAYHLSLHRIEGEERFHLALDKNGRVMDTSRTAQRKKFS